MRKTILFTVFFMLLTIFPAFAQNEDHSLPNIYLEKIHSIPDICQIAPQAGILPQDGENYCGPAAVTNILAWLDNNGFPNMISGNADEPSLYQLMQQLGQYMNVKDDGTSPLRVMKGLHRYCWDRGYEVSIEWQGWRNGGRYTVGFKPDIRWLLQGTLGQSNVLLNVGWYRYDPDKDTYERTGGHWVTMVGYEGAYESHLRIIIHDPKGKEQRDFVNEYCTLKPITSGTFEKYYDYPSGPAAGWLILDGIKRKKHTVAVLDGILRFRVIQ